MVDCSPTNWERDLGLDRRETGCVYRVYTMPNGPAGARRRGGLFHRSSEPVLTVKICLRPSTNGTGKVGILGPVWFSLLSSLPVAKMNGAKADLGNFALSRQ
eukprot:gene9294-biopygen13754